MFFIALILATQISTTPPQIVGMLPSEDACVLAAMKANSMPEVNTDEAKRVGATFVCMKIVKADY